MKFELEKLVNSLGLTDSICFAGNVPDVLLEAHKYGIFVLSSDSEGIPNILMEAMSVGIPSVATDCGPGGTALLTSNGARALLVPVGNYHKLAEAICYYIENPEEANEFGSRGAEIRKAFEPEDIGKRLL